MDCGALLLLWSLATSVRWFDGLVALANDGFEHFDTLCGRLVGGVSGRRGILALLCIPRLMGWRVCRSCLDRWRIPGCVATPNYRNGCAHHARL